MNKIERSPVNSDLLRSFLVIAQTRNLTHASDLLGRTQSAVSVQLRNLEDSLGTALFERSVKGMTLTSAGERLLPKAEAAVAQLQDMRRMFETPLSGHLRIGIPDDYEGYILTDALAQFARLHPGVDVQAISGCTADYPTAVRDGRLDLAVCSSPQPIGDLHISQERAVWASATGLQIRQDAPLPLAMLDRACWWKSIPTDALKRAGRDFRVTFRSESFGSLMAAVRAGFAIGVLPASSVSDDLTVLGPQDGLPELPIIYRTMLFSTQAPEDLVEAMTQSIRTTLYG